MFEIPKTWIVPDWRAPANIMAFVTTRQGGYSQGAYAGFNFGDHVGDNPNLVRENRTFLDRHLPAKPKWINQVHGNKVVPAEDVEPGQAADATFTRVAGIVCVVMTADCLPLLLTDEKGSAVAVAHAGWRGLCDGIIENTVEKFDCNPAKILAFLGPAISSLAYVVGADVRNALLDNHTQALTAFKDYLPGKWHVDLYELARQRLKKSGVEKISGGDFCTFTDSQRFFSYRRDGITGRIASLIWRVDPVS